MRTRVAVIGAGPWGIHHVRVLATEPDVELVAVADLDPGVAVRVAEVAPGVRFGVDARAVLQDPTIDAVVIATSASTHATLACAALGAGKHVLVEKPLALGEADARRVQAAALRSGRVAMVGHLMVFHPAVARMRDLLRAGDLGRIHYLHATRANLGRVRHDENALWSFGPHDLSMLDYLLERSPVSVNARGQCVLQPGIEDVVFLSLRYATGEMAHLHLSWLHPRKERRVTIVGAHKMLEFDDVSHAKLRIYDKGYDRPPEFTEFAQYLTLRDGDVHVLGVSMEEPLRCELRHFVGCIRTGVLPLTDIASGVRVVAILAAAQRSLESDGAPMVVGA